MTAESDAHPATATWTRPYGDGTELAGTYDAKWADVPAPRYSPEQVKILDEEQWLPIPIAKGYEASSHGQIRSLDRFVPGYPGTMRFAAGRILVLDWDDLGYARVRVNGTKKPAQLVSRLVAMAFHGMPTDETPVVRHIDGNPSNNRADNLFWGTQEENVHDTMRHGRHWTFYVEKCPYGHPLVEPNLVMSVFRKRGARACRACNAARPAILALTRKGLPAPSMQELSDEKFAKFMREAKKSA